MIALLSALAPASASAAYAPQLSVHLDQASPGARSRIVTNVTQAAGETANRTVVVSIPKGFSVPVSTINSLPACTSEQAADRACPDSTRVGSAEAVAPVLGLPVKLSGSVNWGGPSGNGQFAILVFLDNDGAGQHITQKGILSINAGGGFDTTFDNLPSTATTSFSLFFDGGDRALVVNPVSCGDFPFQANFTSQSGERAQSTAPVSISGCPPQAVSLDRVRLTTTQASFRLGAAATVRVLVKGPGSKVQLDRRLALQGGTNRVRLKHRLRKGSYRLSVTAMVDGAKPRTRKATLRVRR